MDEIRPGSGVAFDSDAIIYYIEEHQRYLPVVEPVVTFLYDGRAQGHASVINLLEVLVLPLREGRQDLVERYRNALLTHRPLALHDVTTQIALMAASVRSEYRVEVADSIVAATALVSRCDYLITNNRDDFKKIEGFRTLVINDYLTT